MTMFQKLLSAIRRIGRGPRRPVPPMIDGSTSRTSLRRYGVPNGSDDTTLISAALSSGAMAIEIPFQSGTPWHTQPITWTTKRRLMMQDGAHLKASSTGYGATASNLMKGNLLDQVQFLGFDSVLEMGRESLSVSADGPHCLNLRGCTNASIEGLVLQSGSGDGLYVGSDTSGDRTPCRDILVKRLRCKNNRRNGMSITGGVNVKVIDCIFQTNGTSISGVAGASPKCGLDIEPNQPDSAQNISILNCLAEDNDQTGFMVHLSTQTGGSPTVSVLLDSCTARGGNFGLRAVGKAASSVGPTGTVEFRDCTVYDTAWQGLWIDADPGRAHKWKFVRCTFRSVATATSNPIVIDVTDECVPQSSGGIVFEDCVIIDDQDRAPVVVNYTAGDQADDSTLRITGNILVVNPKLTLGAYDVGADNLTVTVASSLS